MSAGTILAVLFLLVLLGGVGPWAPGGYGYGYGHGGVGLVGAVLVIVVVLMLLGRL